MSPPIQIATRRRTIQAGTEPSPTLDAIKFLTCPNAPPTPDGLSGGNAFPDLFEVTGTDLVTIHGLAPRTAYRLGAYCMPDLVAGTASRGIFPSDLDDSQTFTTTL